MTLELYLSELQIYLKNNPKCYKPLPMFLCLLTRLKKRQDYEKFLLGKTEHAGKTKLKLKECFMKTNKLTN